MQGNIRKARVEDALGITTVKVRSWQMAYKGIVHQAYLDAMDIPKIAQRTESWLLATDAPDEHWVYEDDNGIGGWACMWRPTRDEDLGKDVAEIAAIYLLPQYWGQAIGYEMFEKCLEILNNKSAKAVSLWVLEDNHRACRFYERQGFEKDGQRKSINLGGDAPLWEIRYVRHLTA